MLFNNKYIYLFTVTTTIPTTKGTVITTTTKGTYLTGCHCDMLINIDSYKTNSHTTLSSVLYCAKS